MPRKKLNDEEKKMLSRLKKTGATDKELAFRFDCTELAAVAAHTGQCACYAMRDALNKIEELKRNQCKGRISRFFCELGL